MCAHLVVCGRQCCFQRRSCKRSLRPTLRYARSWRSNESACGRSGRRSKGQHEKRGGLWGRKPPRRRHNTRHAAEISLFEMSAANAASPSQPPSATNINPWAGAIFWTTELTIRSELILTKVVPENTVAVRGFEHHTFICSGCHSTVV